MLKQAAAILVALLIATVAATVIVSYVHDMSATVSAISLQRILDTEPLTENEDIPWGMVYAGETVFYNLTVVNTGSVDVNVTVYSATPAGWTLTWVENKSVVAPAASLKADLELTVASDAVPGLVSWSCNVTGAEA